jgi:hypothetical protein
MGLRLFGRVRGISGVIPDVIAINVERRPQIRTS